MKTSAIICAYNSAGRISKTVENLCKQNFDKSAVDLDIIIVDNGCNDATSAVVQETFSKYNAKSIPWRIVEEPKSGLGYARSRGILESSADDVVFVDDDNHLDYNYIARAVSLMRRDPILGVLGGQNTPAFEADPPTWFYTYAPFFAVGVQAPESGDVTKRGYIWGAGMIIRAHVLRDIFKNGGELLLKGRTKSQALAGDDSEICKWYMLAGYTLGYNEELKLEHHMPAKRMTQVTLGQTLNGGTGSVAILRTYEAFLVLFGTKLRRQLGYQDIFKTVLLGAISMRRLDLVTLRRLMRNVRLARECRRS